MVRLVKEDINIEDLEAYLIDQVDCIFKPSRTAQISKVKGMLGGEEEIIAQNGRSPARLRLAVCCLAD